jgi:hypothetical protein
VSIPIANLWERSRLFHIVSSQPNIYDLVSIAALIESYSSILIIILALIYFHAIGKSLELLRNIPKSLRDKTHSKSNSDSV